MAKKQENVLAWHYHAEGFNITGLDHRCRWKVRICMLKPARNPLKEMEARRCREAVFRRKHPTVVEYCEKWLLYAVGKGILPHVERIYP